LNLVRRRQLDSSFLSPRHGHCRLDIRRRRGRDHDLRPDLHRDAQTIQGINAP